MTVRTTRMAIIYDFDGTLAPGNMQERRFIPDVGMNPEEFWNDVIALSDSNNIDPTLAYMFVMMDKARRAGQPIRRERLEREADKIQFFPGVPEWFDRINRFAKQNRVWLDHYVVSSGNAEIIEACQAAQKFTRIYASSFLYDEAGEAVWPAVAVNFTNKTQYLFRINKGALDPKDNHLINEYVPQAERPTPFRNMIFIGDGETDVPCFRLVHDLGGLALAVYDEGKREQARKFVEQDRVSAAMPADYRSNSPLDGAVKQYIKLAAERTNLQITLEVETE